MGIEVSQKGRVAFVTINRPERRNALDDDALKALVDAFAGFEVSDVSTVVIHGSGSQSFCAGSDIKELQTSTESERHAHTKLFLDCMTAIDYSSCATIAAIEGFCLGGGLELALACDYRIASSHSSFGFPEITLGAIPAGGGIVRAPRVIGLARTREMMIFGRRIDAQTAHSWGLASDVVESETTLETARTMADEFAVNASMEAVKLLKSVLVKGQGQSVEASNAMALNADLALGRGASYALKPKEQ